METSNLKNKFKRGDEREDGMVFYKYSKKAKNGEYWITKNKLLKYTHNANVAQKKRYNKNKLRISFKEKERVKRKMQNDPIFKIGRNIRSLIRCSFRNIGLRKNSKTVSILGCSIQSFKQYIESKFKEKMSWENKNLWHLDHIIPISLAKSEEELIKLNHYTNFQPLWAAENIRKSNKIPLGCLIPI